MRSIWACEEAGHGPVAGLAADVVEEVAQQLRRLRGVHDFRVELDAEEFAGIVRDGGGRRALAGGHGAEARRQAGNSVAVAHPDLLARTLGPDAVEQGAILGDVDEGAAELAVIRAQNLAAELGAEQICSP